MAFQLHLDLLSYLLLTFVTVKSHLYLEVLKKVSHLCHTFVTNGQQKLKRHLANILGNIEPKVDISLYKSTPFDL